MDDYDPKRLWALDHQTMRLCPEQLEAFVAANPDLTEDERESLARPREAPMLDRINAEADLAIPLKLLR